MHIVIASSLLHLLMQPVFLAGDRGCSIAFAHRNTIELFFIYTTAVFNHIPSDLMLIKCGLRGRGVQACIWDIRGNIRTWRTYLGHGSFLEVKLKLHLALSEVSERDADLQPHFYQCNAIVNLPWNPPKWYSRTRWQQAL